MSIQNANSNQLKGNCIGLFQNVRKQFDKTTGSYQSSGKHVHVSEDIDLQKIVHQLLVSKVFETTSNRFHRGFETINGKSLTHRINAKKFKEWTSKQYGVWE